MLNLLKKIYLKKGLGRKSGLDLKILIFLLKENGHGRPISQKRFSVQGIF